VAHPLASRWKIVGAPFFAALLLRSEGREIESPSTYENLAVRFFRVLCVLCGLHFFESENESFLRLASDH
jgi:hypothetical protein